MAFINASLKILGFILFLGVALVYFLQYKLLFFPTKLSQNFVFKFSSPHEEKFISYNDKKTVHGLLFKHKKPKARILYFHGNGGALDSWGEVGANITEMLYSDILLLDYPGYGKSSGGLPSSEKELFESAEAAYNDFISSTDQSLPVIVYGRSLGSAVASFLASKKEVQGLILESPYLSVKAMAGVVVPFIPSFLLRYDLDNAKNIQDLKIPILIIHGTIDSVVPYSQSKQLAALKPDAEFVTIEGGDHNNLDGYSLYWQAVEKFVAKITL